MCDECRARIMDPGNTKSVERLDAVISAGLFVEPLRSAIHKLKYESDTPLARALAG